MTELLIHSLPLLTVFLTAIVVLLIGSWFPKKHEVVLVTAIVGLLISIWFAWIGWCAGGAVFGGFFLEYSKFTLISIIVMTISAGLVAISSLNYFTERSLKFNEFITLVLFVLFGGSVMVAGTSLIVIFIGLEILSLAAYVQAGMNKQDAASSEASLKYFTMGAVASAVLLFGIALYYGSTAAFDILNPVILNERLFLVAYALIIAGFGFKVALFPFHWWVPDVYQGAPLPVASQFAILVKIAAFVVFYKVVRLLSNVSGVELTNFFTWTAVITMSIANLAALFQEDVKRMLAYSSIAHAGYILIAFVFIKSDPTAASSSMLFYLISYMVMTAGAFAVLIQLSGSEEKTSLREISGLGRTNPWLAFAMSLFLISLAGFPPTSGFFAKFYLFKSALVNGHVALVIIAVMNSLISIYYYMRPVVALYFGNSSEDVAKVSDIRYSIAGVIIFCLISVILLGLIPSTILAIISG